MSQFKSGDRVRFSKLAKDSFRHNPERTGTFIRDVRGSDCVIVRWDGYKSAAGCSWHKNFIELNSVEPPLVATEYKPTLVPYVGQDEQEVLRGGLKANPDTVLGMFRGGLDTNQISKKLRNTSEAQVYSLLHRQMNEERSA